VRGGGEIAFYVPSGCRVGLRRLFRVEPSTPDDHKAVTMACARPTVPVTVQSWGLRVWWAVFLAILEMGLIASAWAQGECIVTVAGPRWRQGWPASMVAFRGLYGVAASPDGGVWITDAEANRIYRGWVNGSLFSVAGTSVQPGDSGDGGPASRAQLRAPRGVSAASDGGVVFADAGNSKIRRISPSGYIETVAGTGVWGFSGDGGRATQARLASPSGVAVAQPDGMWIADTGNNRVRRVWPNGTITTVAGDGTTSPLYVPVAVASATDSGAWVADSGGVAKVHPLGGIEFRVYVGGSTTGVTVVLDGSIVVALSGNHVVRRAWVNSTSRTVAGTGARGYSGDGSSALLSLLSEPQSVSLAADGSVWIADRGNGRVRRLWTNGTITTWAGVPLSGFSGDGGLAADAVFDQPFGVSVAADGAVWITDRGNHRVRRFWPNGTITTVAGTGATGFSGDGGPGVMAMLNDPRGLSPASDGGVWIADGVNNRVRRLWPNGTITTAAGNGAVGSSGDRGPATAAQLYSPSAVSGAVDGGVWIADTNNNRVRRVWPNGTITTAAGGGGLTGEGVAAAVSQVLSPTGVAAASGGGVFYSESAMHRIRRVWLDGSVTTVAGTSVSGLSGDGGSAAAAQLSWPAGLAEAADGSLWVADSGNHRLRKILRSGIIVSVAESFGLFNPSGVAIAVDGTVWIADTSNHGIRQAMPAAKCGSFARISSIACSDLINPIGCHVEVSGCPPAPPLFANTQFGPCSTRLQPSPITNGTASLACTLFPSQLPAQHIQVDVWLSSQVQDRIVSSSTSLSLLSHAWLSASMLGLHGSLFRVIQVTLWNSTALPFVVSVSFTPTPARVFPKVQCARMVISHDAISGSTNVTCMVPLQESWFDLPPAGSCRSIGLLVGFGNVSVPLALPVPISANVSRPTVQSFYPELARSAFNFIVLLQDSVPWLSPQDAAMLRLPHNATCNGTTSSLRVWVHTSPCTSPRWINATAISCTFSSINAPPLLARVTVEVCGLWNATSDGLNTTAPIHTMNVGAYVTLDPRTVLAAAAAAQMPQVATASGSNLSILLPPQLPSDQLAAVMSRMWLNGTACPALFWDNASLTCVNWSLPLPHAAYSPSQSGVFSVGIHVELRGTRVAVDGDGLRCTAPPRVESVVPATASPGTCLSILGDWFVATTAVHVQVRVGSLPCGNVTRVQYTSLSCCLPATIPSTAAGYPVLRVVVANERGASTNDVFVTVPVEPATVLIGDVSARAVLSSPAGSSAPPFPLAPALAARTTGLGIILCSPVIADHACPSPAASSHGVPIATDAFDPSLTGVTSAVTPSLTAAAPSADVSFGAVGLRARMGCVVNVTVRCTDGLGRATTAPDVVTVVMLNVTAAWPLDAGAVVVAAAPTSLLPAVNASLMVVRSGTAAAATGAAVGLSCLAAVFTAAASTALTQPVAGAANALASAACVIAGDHATVACPPLQLPPASPLGGTLSRLVECAWSATGERVRLPPLQVHVPAVNATLAVANATTDAPVVDVHGYLPLNLTASLALQPLPGSAIVSTAFATADGSCRVTLVGASTPQLQLSAAAAAQSHAVGADGGVGAAGAMAVVLQGPPLSSGALQLVCTVWGQAVSSLPLPFRLRPFAPAFVNASASAAVTSLPSSVSDDAALYMLSLQLLAVSSPAAGGSLSCTLSIASHACPPAGFREHGAGYVLAALPLRLAGEATASVMVASGADAAVSVTWASVGVSAAGGCNLTLAATCRDGESRTNATSNTATVMMARLSGAWDGAADGAVARVVPAALPVVRGTLHVALPAPASVWSCTAGLSLTGVAVRVNASLASQSRRLVGGAVVDGTVSDWSQGWMGVAFDGLSGALLPLGGAAWLQAECVWSATGERVRLPPLPTAVAALSVAPALLALGGVVAVVPGAAATLNVTVTPDWAGAPLPAVSCVVQATGPTGPLSLAAQAVQVAGWGVPTSLPFTLSGPPSLSLAVAVRCTAWEQIASSPPFTLATAALETVVVAAPTVPILLSSASSVSRLLPQLAVRVQSPGVIGAAVDVVCSLTTRAGGGFTLATADGEPADTAFGNVAPGGGGVVEFPEFGVVGSYAGDGAAANATLVVTCTRSGGSPPPLRLDLGVLAARMVVCLPPATSSTSQTRFNRFSVGVTLASAAASSDTARDAVCGSHPAPPPVPSWPSLSCRITEAPANGSSNGVSDVLLQGAGVTNTANQRPLVAEFAAFALSAPPAATYALRLGCSLGDVSLPQVRGQCALACQVRVGSGRVWPLTSRAAVQCSTSRSLSRGYRLRVTLPT